MSERERAVQMVNDIPEYKLGYVLAYLQGRMSDEAEDDAFCERLYQDYLNDPDKGDFISIEEAAKMCGVDINDV